MRGGKAAFADQLRLPENAFIPRPGACPTPARLKAETANTPAGLVEKHLPDGRRQLVTFDLVGKHVIED